MAICREIAFSLSRLSFYFGGGQAGQQSDAKIAMTLITTSNCTIVNPTGPCFNHTIHLIRAVEGARHADGSMQRTWRFGDMVVTSMRLIGD
jgi:hypothetical protein